MNRSVEIIRRRIAKLGFSGAKVSRQGSDQILIEFSGALVPSVVDDLVVRQTLLEFYDFEADLTGPSVSNLARVPVASASLYDLVGPFSVGGTCQCANQPVLEAAPLQVG